MANSQTWLTAQISFSLKKWLLVKKNDEVDLIPSITTITAKQTQVQPQSHLGDSEQEGTSAKTYKKKVVFPSDLLQISKSEQQII